MCVCIHLFIYAARTLVCMQYIYLYAYMYVPMCMYLYSCVLRCIYASMHVRMYLCVCTYIHVSCDAWHIHFAKDCMYMHACMQMCRTIDPCAAACLESEVHHMHSAVATCIYIRNFFWDIHTFTYTFFVALAIYTHCNTHIFSWHLYIPTFFLGICIYAHQICFFVEHLYTHTIYIIYTHTCVLLHAYTMRWSILTVAACDVRTWIYAHVFCGAFIYAHFNYRHI